MGATSASVSVDGVELCASFKAPRKRERQPAIGFMLDAGEECEGD